MDYSITLCGKRFLVRSIRHYHNSRNQPTLEFYNPLGKFWEVISIQCSENHLLKEQTLIIPSAGESIVSKLVKSGIVEDTGNYLKANEFDNCAYPVVRLTIPFLNCMPRKAFKTVDDMIELLKAYSEDGLGQYTLISGNQYLSPHDDAGEICSKSNTIDFECDTDTRKGTDQEVINPLVEVTSSVLTTEEFETPF